MVRPSRTSGVTITSSTRKLGQATKCRVCANRFAGMAGRRTGPCQSVVVGPHIQCAVHQQPTPREAFACAPKVDQQSRTGRRVDGRHADNVPSGIWRTVAWSGSAKLTVVFCGFTAQPYSANPVRRGRKARSCQCRLTACLGRGARRGTDRGASCRRTPGRAWRPW